MEKEVKNNETEIKRLRNRAVEKEMKTDFETPPKNLNSKNVIYWSEHYKKLNGVEGASAIQTKARKFVDLNLVKYDKETKNYCVEPIPGYNSTTYHLKFNKILKDFECSCQYYQTKMKKNERPICSHNLAVWLSIKIANWNRSAAKKEEAAFQVKFEEHMKEYERQN